MTQAVMDPPAAATNGNGNGENALARQYKPTEPIRSPKALQSLLSVTRGSIAQALPRHVTPERLIKTMLVAANRNPDILECTQASILETVNRAAELGLDLSGTLGEAYPVPFNNKMKGPDGREFWIKQLQLIIGYRGLEKLAWQSGEVESIDAEVVCQHDQFVFRKGTEVQVEWSPKIDGDRGAVLGAYACVKLKSGGKLARFLPKADIEKIRASSKSKDSPAWRNWWDEMARKCALKRTLKDAPLSTEKFVKAMEHDEADYALADVLEAQTQHGNRTQRLLNKVTGRPVSEGQTLEPTPEALAAAERELADDLPETDSNSPAAEAEHEPHQDAEPPERDDADVLIDQALGMDREWSDVDRVLLDAATEHGGYGKADARKAIDAHVKLKLGKAGKEREIPLKQRREMYFALRETRLTLKGEITPAAAK